jgi:hypothetical protein
MKNKMKNKMKTLKNKNKNKKYGKKVGGDVFSFFSSTPTTSTQPILPTNETLSSKAQTASDAAFNLSKKTKLATTASAAAIGALAATGIGIPVAGALTSVLIIAKLMANVRIYNKKLITMLLDVLNIITHGNKLNLAIETVLKYFSEKTNMQIKIDEEIKIRLNSKLQRLMQYLLNLATDDVIDILNKDNTLDSKTREIVLAESNKRNEQSFIKRTYSIANRGFNRNIRSEYKISEIGRELTVINGYFMLMKSQYDMLLNHLKHKLPTETFDGVWDEIVKDESYTSYVLLNMEDYLSTVENNYKDLPEEADTNETSKGETNADETSKGETDIKDVELEINNK